MKLRVCDHWERKKSVRMKMEKMLIFYFTVMRPCRCCFGCCFCFSFSLSMIRFIVRCLFFADMQQYLCSKIERSDTQATDRMNERINAHTNVHCNLRSKCINVFRTDYSYWLYDSTGCSFGRTFSSNILYDAMFACTHWYIQFIQTLISTKIRQS